MTIRRHFWHCCINRIWPDLVSFIWIGWALQWKEEATSDGARQHISCDNIGRPEKKRPSLAGDGGKKYCTLCYLISVRAGVMSVYKQSLSGERTSWCSCGPEMLSMIGHGGKFGGSIESNLFHLKIHMMWKCEEEKRGYFRAIFSSQVFRPSVWVGQPE